MPEKKAVKKDMLSDYRKLINDKYNISIDQVLLQKLIPNLNSREKYVLHYRNLQLYLSLGLKIKIEPISLAKTINRFQ